MSGRTSLSAAAMFVEERQGHSNKRWVVAIINSALARDRNFVQKLLTASGVKVILRSYMQTAENAPP